MLKLTDDREFFTNKQILAIYLQQAKTSEEIFKNYPDLKIKLVLCTFLYGKIK